MRYYTSLKKNKMKQLISIVIFLAACHTMSAQKDVFLHINPFFNNGPFQLNTPYTGIDGVVVNIDHFDYYVSDVVLFHDGGVQTNVSPAVYLFTPEEFGFFLGTYNIQDLDSIRFLVGVPARLNTQSGVEAVDISSYPDTHPLSFQNPTMYWGWQFGYMHMIVGGEADSNNDQIPDAYFEMHNLGDHNTRMIQMPVIETQTNSGQMDLYLTCNIDEWLREMPLSTVGVLHGQSGLNESIMSNVQTYNVFTQPATADLNTNLPSSVYVEGATLYWEDLQQASFTIFDLSGRLVSSGFMNEEYGSAALDMNTGYYILRVYDAQHRALLTQEYFIVNP